MYYNNMQLSCGMHLQIVMCPDSQFLATREIKMQLTFKMTTLTKGFPSQMRSMACQESTQKLNFLSTSGQFYILKKIRFGRITETAKLGSQTAEFCGFLMPVYVNMVT